MPINNIQPLQGLNKMSLSNLSDREREQWYAANQNALSKYNPIVRKQAAELIYQNQQFIKKFGKDEFYKTASIPEAAAFRQQQLENRLVEEAWRNTFKPKHTVVTDINTGVPYMQNGRPMMFERKDEDVNVDDAWYQKYSGMDTQAKRQLLEMYSRGEWQPEKEIQKNNVFSKYEKQTPSIMSSLKYLFGDKSKENAKDVAANAVKIAQKNPITAGIELITGSLAETIGEGRDYYNKTNQQSILDKLYDESTHRIAESPEVSKLKSEAYLDNSIVGATDEETKNIFYSIITPTTDKETGENVNLGIPTYAAYFDGGKNIQSEVKDIGIDEMRKIIATKYAMEKAGIPKDRVRDMLERLALKHVAANEGWWKGKKKFVNDVIIASSSYTADKWNGIKNLKYMVEDSQDGGVNVWVDDNGNTVGEVDHPELTQNQNVSWDDRGNGIITSSYIDEDGKEHTVHKEKIRRSALLMKGKEVGGDNAGGESKDWANPEYWTKAEQYGIMPKAFSQEDEEQIKKWDKIGASPYAKAWDPDEGTHIMYDSFKMMSFGLADQAMMFLPMGAGILSKSIKSASTIAKAAKATLELASKLGPASKVGQVFNNAAASLGIGFAYGRSNAYELFEKNLAGIEQTLRTKSESDIENKYNNDSEYRAAIDQRIAELTQYHIQQTLAENAEDIRNGSIVVDNTALQEQAAYQAYQQVQEEELQKQMEINMNSKDFQDMQEQAINTAAYSSNIMQVTDAMKYFAVGAYGYRRYLYENPTGLFKQTHNTVKEALRGTKSALKHVKEVKNADGKLRLATTVGKDFIGTKNQAKQLGKVYASQFTGGAWTNGTDDMQVDGVQMINEDTMQNIRDAYLAGEPIADVAGTIDQVSSFMTGMGESLGQKSTWDVTLIGGLGSTISGNFNFANIASIMTKEGRKAFREQYNTRYKRNALGEIEYDTEEVLDKDGNPILDENGNTVTRKVPKKEQLKWNQNWREKVGFFVQNGILNTYYGNKQAALSKVDRVLAANDLLDELGDFEDLEDYISADAARDNVMSEREKRTSSFLKALRLARALDNVGKNQEGGRDIDDPMLKSSAYQKAKDLIAKANSMEIYDTGVNIGDFTPEEAENMLKEWYSKNPQEVRSEAKDVEALRSIAENAKELTKAMNAYDEASEHISKSEQKSNKTFSSHVKNKMIEDCVLYNHWQNRINKLRRETNDASSFDTQPTSEQFIASIGGLTNAENLGQIYDLMIDGIRTNEKAEADKNVENSRKKLETARNKYDNAETTEEKQTAEKELNDAYSQYDRDLAMQEYADGMLSRLEEKRDQVNSAMEETHDMYTSELQDTVGHLNNRKQGSAISRGRKLYNTQKRIKELSERRRSDRGSFTAEETNELNTLRKQERVDKKWLKENLNMDDAQLQQFMSRINSIYVTNAQNKVLSADEIMSLDPVTRSKMLDPENRRLYSAEQIKEIDNLIGRLNMQDPAIVEKLHDIARLGQQMNRVMDSYKRLSQHPEGAALAIEADRKTAAEAAHQLIDRRFARDIANFIEEFDDKIIVNSTDESNDIVSAIEKYRDRVLNAAAIMRFLQAKQEAYDLAKYQGRKPQITQREKNNAVFQLLRTLNSRILDILDKEHYIEKYRTELDNARRWVATIEDVDSLIKLTIPDGYTKQDFSNHVLQMIFFTENKEDIMRLLEIEANHPTKPEFKAHILNLLDDLEELGHMRNATVVKENAKKYKDVFKQKAESLINAMKKTADKALASDTTDNELEDFISNLNENARNALEAILKNSKTRNLNQDGTRYIIDNKGHVRVTSVKHLLKGSRLSPFDESSPWSLPSTSIGNSLDEFGRDVFNGIYDKMTEEQRLQEFEKRYDNSTAKNYEEVYKALKAFQSKLKDKNQRIIKLGNTVDNQGSAVAAGVINVTMPDGTTKQMRVAGSLDILAIDNQGNLHIYDFKTSHSKSGLNITEAVSKGYDRQLSMYAKLLEEEYGLKVASINILPVHVNYPAPTTTTKWGKRDGATYKKDKNSNQLKIKEKGKVTYKEFKEANFEVRNSFSLVRLQEGDLTIDYNHLSIEEKAEVDTILAEQSREGSTTANTESSTNNNDNIQSKNLQDIDLGEDETDTQEESAEKKNEDNLYNDIVYLIQDEESISVPWLMREFKVTSERAIQIMKQLEKDGIVDLFDSRTASHTVRHAPIKEITTAVKRGDTTLTGHYSVEKDAENYMHIVFDRGNAFAKRSIPLSQLDDALLDKLSYNGRTVKQAGVERLSISDIIIDPEGNVVIGTLWGSIDGEAARKIFDKTFPELKNYMQQFPQPVKQKTQNTVPLKVNDDVQRIKDTLEPIPGQVYYSEKTDNQGYKTIKFARGIVKKNGTPAVIAGNLAGVFIDLPIKELIDDDSYNTFYEETDIWDKDNYRVTEIRIAPDGKVSGTILLKEANSNAMSSFEVSFKVNPINNLAKNQLSQKMLDVLNKQTQTTEVSQSSEEALSNGKEISMGENSNATDQTTEQEIETSENIDDALHDNGTDVWVESTEGNINEAEATDGFDESNEENGTLTQANAQSAEPSSDETQANDAAINDGDTRILSLSANAHPYYHNTLDSSLATQGKPVTRVEYIEEQNRKKNEPVNENDQAHALQRLLDGLGIRYQDIIDEEVAAIFMEKPDTQIKYMAVNWVSDQFKADRPLSMTCFLVVDYDSTVRRIHSDGRNGTKNNGGVVTVDGKEYLIIGIMGFGDTSENSPRRNENIRKRDQFWNPIFGRNIGPQRAMGFAKKAAADYFLNPEHNGERFYVAKNSNGEFYSTRIKEGSITPGWFVKGPKVRLSQLLFGDSAAGLNRQETNPLDLKWDTLDFGIAEYTGFRSTVSPNMVMQPDLTDNAGRAFVLIPAGNGKYAPAYIQPTKYSELVDNSPLKQRIDELIDKLLSRKYDDRLDALKKLYKYLYLNSGESETDVNILLRKRSNIITIERAGKRTGDVNKLLNKEFNLDSADFDRNEFKAALAEANPLINITPATLKDITMLKEYDESGALMLDLAMLRTMGSNYEIWPSTANNEVLKPAEPMSQHRTESHRVTGTQIPYNGQYYIADSNGVYRDQTGQEVTDASLIEELEINKRILESSIQPVKSSNNKNTYILDQSINSPLVVEVDANSYKVTKLNNSDAVVIIQEAIEKREQEARDKAAEKQLDDESQRLVDEANPAKPEVPEQTREKELKELEEAHYSDISNMFMTDKNSKDISLEQLESNINDIKEALDATYNSEEDKAIFRGILRAYEEEVEKRKSKGQSQKSTQQPETTGVNSNSQKNTAGTITFIELIADKNNLRRVMEALKKFPDAPRGKSELAEYLRKKKIEVDSIGNTEDDIKAWFRTLEECKS